jgi:hypothetical protein
MPGSEAVKADADVLWGDRDFAIAALQKDKRAIKYASANLRGDRDFVLAAITLWQRDDDDDDYDDYNAVYKGEKDDGVWGCVMAFLSGELQGNKEVFLAAARSKWPSRKPFLAYSSAELQQDGAFIIDMMSE